MTALALVPPVFGNLLRGLVQPISVSGQTDHLDRRKPLGRIAPKHPTRPNCATAALRPGCRSIRYVASVA